jgi:sugar lactone lactonase YvrE
MGDGRIMRFETDGSNPELFVNTGGRPAGMAFDANRNMLVADTKLGLLSIAPNGAVTVLTTEADGRPIVLANDLDIATDGTVYFTDYRFYPDNVSDFLDGRPLTRLLAYDPRTQETRVVLDGLYAANGVALSPDESFVLVGEMTAYRVVRYWLSGPKQGQTDIFIENLPGFPDSIRFNGQDIYWLTLLAPRSSFKEFLQANPFWRGVLRRVPFLLEIAFSYPASSGFVLGLDRSGDVVYNLQDSSGKVASQISCACEYEGMLYLGSMSRTAIYRLPAP